MREISFLTPCKFQIKTPIIKNTQWFNLKTIIGLFVIAIFSSCNSNHFEKSIRFENNNWIKFNNLEFEIPVEAGNSYSFSGNIITDSTFNKRKMEIGFYLYLPSGEERLSDMTFRILDFEYQPMGKITTNGILNEVTFKENVRSSESGKIKLKVVLHSQYYDNPGIIGLDLFVKEK